MKKTFYFSTNFLHKSLWIFVMLILLISCKNKPTPPQPVFDLDTPGGEVVATFQDNSPGIIHYYKLDENGNKTPELIGETKFYIDGQVREGGNLKNGKRNGQWYAFFQDGSVQVEAFYVDGIEDGPYNVFRENGTPYFKGHYTHGVCDGTWYWYDETGKQLRKIKADEKTPACESCKKCFSLKQGKNEDLNH